jgi:hypothetical protein
MARQKAMGEALFEMVLAELVAQSGIPKGPLIGSLIFLECSFSSDPRFVLILVSF